MDWLGAKAVSGGALCWQPAIDKSAASTSGARRESRRAEANGVDAIMESILGNVAMITARPTGHTHERDYWKLGQLRKARLLDPRRDAPL